MKTKMKWIALFTVLALLLVPTATAAAQGLQEGRVIIAQTFTLESGETLDGDLVVMGGSATIQEGALVDGNIVLMGGSLVVSGEVARDTLVMGGSVILGETALLHGNLTTLGATLVRAEGAVIEGEIFNAATTAGNDNGGNGNYPVIPHFTQPFINIDFDLFREILRVLSWSVVLGLLAMLVTAFLPEPTRRVAQAAINQPVVAGGIGLLTYVLLPLALVILAVTLILILIVPLAALLVVVMMAFGWIALGTEAGMRLTRGGWSMPLASGLGTFLLTLLAMAIGAIPCIGWLVPFVLGSVALGAVFISRFGAQAVGPSKPASPVPVEPAAPVLPVEPSVGTPAPKRRAKKETGG